MQVTFSSQDLQPKEALVVGVFQGHELSLGAKHLDETTQGLIKTALASNRFKGKIGETLSLIAPPLEGTRRILLIGLGQKDTMQTLQLENIGGHIYQSLASTPDQEVLLNLKGLTFKEYDNAIVAAHVAYGMLLRSWRFDTFKTKQKTEDKPQLKKATLQTDDASKAERIFKDLELTAQGVFLCRDLVSQPANILHPENYPIRIKEELAPLGITVEILGVKEMQKLGMGALLGVGQGSSKESHLVVMQWKGGSQDQRPLAFLGKGVTFDTGGISIKPAGGMEEMKHDMAGSAAVVGLMKVLALRKAKVNVVGVVGLVENMPSGTAQRPGDIVTTMSGQTVEVLNTDAEGRLVLADALWYTQDRFKPQWMINLATLTGAILISLGDFYAGLFSNNDTLADNLRKAGEKTGEGLWRLPMGEGYDRMLDCRDADMQNISNGRKAGSITAAQFLQRFVNETPWAHLDIAGVANITDRQLPTAAQGATGFGVRLLDQLVRDYYEA